MSPDAITHLIIEYRYWMLIALAFLEGPVVAFVAGFLSSLGYFNPWVVMVILVGKDIAVDAVYYGLGRWGDRGGLVRHYSKKIGIDEEHWDKVEELWHTHPWRTMFISKLSYGLSLPFLVSAGLTRMPYKRFWFYAAQIAFLQYGLLVFVGYFFGNSIGGSVVGVLNNIQIIVGVVAAVAVVFYLVRKRMNKRLLNMERNKNEEL